MRYDEKAQQREAPELDPHSSDSRSRFGHDRDRILYASAFRRLAGKSQVVAASELGLYHTRLTHTLKVGQLGRRIAERLQREYFARGGDVGEWPAPADPDLVEAACLAHDLGHPPFGHAGETALRMAFDERAKRLLGTTEELAVARLGGFEGNAQTFRILTYLAARPPWSPRVGLNLTRATLDAATKYPCLRVHGEGVQRKWGAFVEDETRLRRVRDGHGVGPDAARCFEADIMDWCDDITFAVHDVVDFFRGGFIPLHELFFFRSRRGATEISEAAVRFLGHLARRDPVRWDLEKTQEAWRAIAVNAEVYDSWEPTREKKTLAQATTSQLITHFVSGITYQGAAPCTHEGKFRVDADDDVERLKRLSCDLLKQLLWYFVIDQAQLASHQQGHRAIVRGLFEIYCDNADELLPPDRLEDLDDHDSVLRAASDHVASLTEQEAEVLHQRLTGTRLGAITEAI